MTGHLTICIRDLPEWQAMMRKAMADALRTAAEGEASGYVRDRLSAVAAAFEAGQQEDRG